MNANIYTLTDLAAYNWIEIGNRKKHQSFEEREKKPIKTTKLVAKWLRNDAGELYCCWMNEQL